MTSGWEGRGLTDRELAGLTDGELVKLRDLADAEIDRLMVLLCQSEEYSPRYAQFARLREPLADSSFRDYCGNLLTLLSGPETEAERRFVTCWRLQPRIGTEMDRRLPQMLRNVRLALGLTHRDVSQMVWIHAEIVDEIERGQRGVPNFQGFFERVCSVGGLGPIEESVRLSAWFPLADPRLCRTIREVAVAPTWLSWNDGASLALARTIREGQAFHLLPILGDALEEAGCAEDSILDHCRNPGLHALGCWVVDALVGAGRRE